MASILLAIDRCARHLFKSRSSIAEQSHATGTEVSNDIADVDIYCSTSQYGPAMFEPALKAGGLNPIPNPSGGRQKFTRRPSNKKDEVAMVVKLEGQIQGIVQET
jgi:hypothetical protein